MAQRSYLRSFSGGQISPEMTGRIDDRRYQTGLKKSRNFVTLPHGPARNRPGTRYVAGIKNNGTARLIRFNFSITDQLQIEMGSGYFRFYENGVLTTFPTPLDFITSKIVPLTAGVDPGTPGVVTGVEGVFVTSLDHDFVTGDRLCITSYLNAGSGLGWKYWDEVPSVEQYYYAEVTSAKGFKLRETPTGPAIGISSIGTGTGGASHYVTRAYELGEIVDDGAGNFFQNTQFPLQYFTSPGWVSVGPLVGDYWVALPASGAYEAPNPYGWADLFEINWRQSNDVITFTHRNYPIYELRRYGASRWLMVPVTLAPTLDPPANPGVVVGSYGDTFIVDLVASASIVGPGPTNVNPSRWRVRGQGDCSLTDGTTVILSNWGGTYGVNSVVPQYAGEYVIDKINGSDFDVRSTTSHDGAIIQISSGNLFVTMRAAPLSSERENYYKITAVDADGHESQPTAAVHVLDNNLLVEGAFNTVSWDAVVGADHYRIYKKLSGVFGFIAKVDAADLTLKDDSLDPRLDETPPILDDSLSGTDYPGAVGYHQGRRGFGGSTSFPQQTWWTRSGTESDLSFSLPYKDDDALSFEVKANEASTVMHLTSLGQLLIFTNSTEFVARSPEDSVITPDSIEVVVQSTVGASFVDPIVVGNVVVFCSTSGHVHALAYNAGAQGFVPADLSLRAADLFDGFAIKDSTFCKAPYPIVWFTSSCGELRGLTMVPDQEVLGWHWHDTQGGFFESVSHAREGNEDVLYMIVRRVINGSVVRYIERLAYFIEPELSRMTFVDSASEFRGTNLTVDGSIYVIVTGGTTWEAGEEWNCESVGGSFVPGDVGDIVEVTQPSTGLKFELTITAYVNGANVTVVGTETFPTTLRAAANSAYAMKRADLFATGLDYLEGETVSILADGIVMPQQVVASGGISLPLHYVDVSVGLPIAAELETLQVSVQLDGYGQGRPKQVRSVSMRVVNSGVFNVGPTYDNVTPSDPYHKAVLGELAADELVTKPIDVPIPQAWTDEGQVFVTQPWPLPVTIAGMTLEVTHGG